MECRIVMNCEIQSKDTSYFKEKVGLGRYEEEEEEEDDAYAMHHPRLSRVVCTRLQDQKKLQNRAILLVESKILDPKNLH